MRTGLNLLKVVVAVAVAVSVSNAMAQGGGKGRGGGFGRGGLSPITVVKVEGVQADLQLDQGQKDKLASLEATQIDRQAMADLSQEDRQKKVAEIRAGDLKKVDEILLPPQRERLAEIMLQLEGPRALVRPEVATKLKLTDDQKSKLTELFQPGQGGFGGGQGGGQGGFAAAMEELNKKAMDILTADQRDQYTKMQGKKTEVSMRDIMGAGGGFGNKGRKGGKGNKGPDA